MSTAKLKNAPLREVVFELHWSGNTANPGHPGDDGFDLAQGKFASKLQPDYPLHKKLMPDGIPIKIVGVPMHQYRKSEFTWPVVQHGLGMMSVNETEAGYEWEATFKPTVLSTIEKLKGAYEETLIFNKTRLVYIDAWDLDGEDAKSFAEKNLLTTFKSDFPQPGKLKNFSLSQTFDLEDGSILQLVIGDGLNNKSLQTAIIWTTTVEKKGNLGADEIPIWLEQAHSTASQTFKQMLNLKFYEKLDQ